MNLLFIVPYMPNPVRTRPYHLLRALAQRGHTVTLATLWENAAEQAALQEFSAQGVRVLAAPLGRMRVLRNLLRALPDRLPLQARYCWQPALAGQLLAAAQDGQFDAIHVEHLRGVEYALYLQRALGPACPPVVWDAVDCISLLFEQAARHSRSPFGRWVTLFDLPRTRRYEGWLVRQFAGVLVTSQADRLALERLAEQHSPLEIEGSPVEITVLPNGVDASRFTPQQDGRRTDVVVFSGKMSYHANITAAHHLVEEIMPLVWAQQPQVEVWIAGKDPGEAVQRLGEAEKRVKVIASAPDLAPYIAQATAAAAPIVYGAGIQNKVLEAMACGTPVVASPTAAQALQAVGGQDYLLAETPQEFAAALLRLLNDPALRARLAQNGRAYVLRQHDWQAAAAALEEVYFRAGHVVARSEGTKQPPGER